VLNFCVSFPLHCWSTQAPKSQSLLEPQIFPGRPAAQRPMMLTPSPSNLWKLEFSDHILQLRLSWHSLKHTRKRHDALSGHSGAGEIFSEKTTAGCRRSSICRGSAQGRCLSSDERWQCREKKEKSRDEHHDVLIGCSEIVFCPRP